MTGIPSPGNCHIGILDTKETWGANWEAGCAVWEDMKKTKHRKQVLWGENRGEERGEVEKY